MDKEQQIALVNDVCMRMALGIGTRIEGGKVPEDWDGHELRALLAEKFTELASRSEIIKQPRSQRAKAYRNHLLITTL